MSPNRLVALVTPLAAPLAGWVATQAATQLPGLDLPKSALEEIFIAGALIALAPAAQWLHGWQKWEAQQAQTEAAVRVATVEAAADPPTVQVDIKQDDGFEQEEGIDEGDGFDSSFDLDEFDDFDDFDDELFADEEPAPVGA
jgi:acyl-CoA synthetase (AMP-forming)/AMP-acid ligase II